MQSLELLTRNLSADQSGDPDYGGVDPGPNLSIAVVVCCSRLFVVRSALLILDHRRSSSRKIRSRVSLELEAVRGQREYMTYINMLRRTTAG